MTDHADHPERPARTRLATGAWAPTDALSFEFIASSGPGGQNVNKRATKARLSVALDAIHLPEAARLRLRRLAGALLTDDGRLVIAADEFRSQRRNREAAIDRLRELVAEACRTPTPRRPTKPTRGSVQRRLDAKRSRGQTKARRRNDADD